MFCAYRSEIIIRKLPYRGGCFMYCECYLLNRTNVELRVGKEAHETSNDDYMSKGSAYTGIFSCQGFCIIVLQQRNILKTIIPNRVPALFVGCCTFWSRLFSCYDHLACTVCITTLLLCTRSGSYDEKPAVESLVLLWNDLLYNCRTNIKRCSCWY
jgi:hypothetical protein